MRLIYLCFLVQMGYLNAPITIYKGSKFNFLTFSSKQQFEDHQKSIKAYERFIEYHQCQILEKSGKEIYSIKYSQAADKLLVSRIYPFKSKS